MSWKSAVSADPAVVDFVVAGVVADLADFVVVDLLVPVCHSGHQIVQSSVEMAELLDTP